MKRLLVPILLLALCSPVTAGLFITVDGVVDPPEVNMLFGEHAVIGIWGDGETEPYVFFLGVAAGDPGTLDIANAVILLPVPRPPPVHILIWWDDCEFAEILGLNCPVILIELTDGSPAPPPLIGQLVDLISFHCEGPGDVTLMLFNADGELMDTQLIHQGAPPPALEILEPNGGEYYRAGTGQEIRFVDNRTPGEYLPNYQRRLSANNGQTWMFWIGGPPPNCEAGECSWQWYAPGMDWDNCLVRIFDANDPEADDTSDASFTIYTGTLYVNAADGNDANNGITPETAFATIQKAIDTASEGDTIRVAPGTYVENIRIQKEGLTIHGAGPELTTIDGGENGHVVVFNPASGSISGFMITNSGGNPRYSAGVFTSQANVNIENCVISNNNCGITYSSNSSGIIANNRVANNSGHGIEMMTNSHATMTNNVIAHNSRSGIYCKDSSPIINNTIVNNGFCGIQCAPQADQIIANNIICANEFGILVVGGECSAVPQVKLSHNNVWGNTEADYKEEHGVIVIYSEGSFGSGEFTPPSTAGEISEDPLFADPNNDDYHLKSQAGRYDPNTQSWAIDDVTSLCIDAGDPMTPINFEPFPNGGIVNIGAYGGTPEAGKSYFGKPPCTTIIAGDVNGDCIVNFKDAVIMFSHWLEGSMP